MDRKTDLRLWAVLFWLAAWQIAAMALAARPPFTNVRRFIVGWVIMPPYVAMPCQATRAPGLQSISNVGGEVLAFSASMQPPGARGA